ncbi:hypothetical protein HZ326_10007 [Fusarium oxysporum f. sp. albedinis]|nr:hypothetical protein HZ326_10007 [Fusarium oxysporum f. sp. albedinis]
MHQGLGTSIMGPGRAQLQNCPLGTTLCTSSCPLLPLHSRRRRYARFHSPGYGTGDACFISRPVRLADHLDAGSGRLLDSVERSTSPIPSKQPSLFRPGSSRLEGACGDDWPLRSLVGHKLVSIDDDMERDASLVDGLVNHG